MLVFNRFVCAFVILRLSSLDSHRRLSRWLLLCIHKSICTYIYKSTYIHLYIYLYTKIFLCITMYLNIYVLYAHTYTMGQGAKKISDLKGSLLGHLLGHLSSPKKCKNLSIRVDRLSASTQRLDSTPRRLDHPAQEELLTTGAKVLSLASWILIERRDSRVYYKK
jgi:hypothetical protein